MFHPISFKSDSLLVHPFRPEDISRYDDLSQDILDILSDSNTLKYLPSKRIHNIEQAETFLQTMILNGQARKNYIHFITDLETGRTIGMIDLISPDFAREHYQISHYPYFIEFYLRSSFTGCAIMTRLLPKVMNHLLQQDIPVMGAIINRKNIAARKVLEKAKFNFAARFDVLQDFYERRKTVVL